MSYTKDPLYGNYLGIVVNKEDPEYRGRVQVWIPHLTNTLHSEWNDELKNKSFKHIHDSGALTPKLVQGLKEVLPWAECAAPIIGGGTSATYNDQTGITDTNPHKTLVNPLSNISGTTKDNVKYAFSSGTIRDQLIQDDLMNKLSEASYAAYGPDAKVIIYSGGQDEIGTGSKRTGTTRHDNGYAADVYIEKDGRYLTGEELSPMIQNWLGNKNGGVGYGMLKDRQKAGLHLDIRKPDQGSQYSGTYWSYQGKETDEPSIVQAVNRGNLGILPTSQYIPDSVVTKTAMDAAEIPGTTVNPAANAKSADRTVKDAYSSDLTARYDSLNPNVKKVMYGLGMAETGFNPAKATSMSNNSYRNYVRYPDGRTEEVESLENLPKGTNILEVRNKWVAQEYAKNGGDLSAAQKKDGDTGYLQTSENMNQQAGVALNTGTPAEQVVKNWDYIKRFYPDAAAAAESGNTNEAFRLLGDGRWPSLKPGVGKTGREGLERAIEGSNKSIADIDAHVKSGVTIDPYDGNYQLNPIPNHNPHVNSPMLAGDQPSGMLSIPNPGAKVFVFFLGGDIQKPVYFANSLEPETIKKMGGYGSDNFQSNVAGAANSSFGSGPVRLDLTTTPYSDTESHQKFNLSAGGSGLFGQPHDIKLVGMGDVENIAHGDMHNSMFNSSSNIGGNMFSNINNNCTINCGIPLEPKEQKAQEEALQKLKKILDDVQKQKIEQIESTAKSGEKVACPICSVQYATEKASSFSKKAFGLIRNHLPYFSYAIDVLQFLTTLILIPFISVTTGGALGKCKNPDCSNGEIPSPQKPIEEANRKAAETLLSKQKEIADLEKQLGNGGNYTVNATKDIIISAGLGINDSKCYSKTVNQSTPIKLQGASGGCLHLESADLEGTMPVAPIQFPGGNVLIKGGNSVKIIAGSPGIELMTKGKLSLNCGSLEILTSDGEMVVGSTNKTTLKGRVVTIDAENGSNTGGINMNAPNTLIKGLSVTGNAAIKGALKIEGELSCKYINTVAQRLQSDMGGSPDQRIPFSNWATGSCQTNDILNSIRTAITHFLMPGAILTLTNIFKFVMQCYNTILTNTIMEYSPTGIFFGLYSGPILNWHHNQLEDPKPIHVDYITPKGIYFDDGSGVDANSVDPGPVPTRARRNGMGMEGGPKSLAGCGGFGNWGGGIGGNKKGRLNSFGLGDIEAFTGTRIKDKNVKYEFNKDGNIKFKLDPSPCD